MKNFVVLSALLWFNAIILAQTLTQFTHYSVGSGLSENNVVCMLQDRKGNMWFGTYDGLNKFDGCSFKTYKGNFDGSTVLLNPRIDKIREDNDGYIWIQTYDGRIYRFNPRTERFLPVPQCEPGFNKYKSPLKAIYTLGDGSIWLLGGDNKASDCFRIINKGNPDRVTTEYFPLGNSRLPSNDVRKLYLDKQQDTWIFTAKGLGLLKHNEGRIIHLFKKDGKCEFFAICETSSLIYLGGERGLVKVYDYKKGAVEDIKLPVDASVIEIREINNNELFILTNKAGFCLFDRKSKKCSLYNTSSGCGLLSNNFYNCCMDKHHNVWLNTDNPSVVYFECDKRKVNNFSVFTGSSETFTSGLHFMVIEDKLGNTWVQSSKGGFSLYNRTLNKLEPFYNDPQSPDRKFSNIVRTALLDTQGNLWMSPYSFGVEKIVFRESPFRFYRPVPGQNFLEQNMIRALFQDNENNLWVGTKYGYLYLFDAKRNLLGRLGSDGKLNSAVPLNVPVYHIMTDHNGVTWLASKGMGLFKLVKNGSGKNISFTITNYQSKPDDIYSLSSNSVYQLFEDHLKRLWVATYGGGINLMEEKDGQVRFINYRNKLKNYPPQCNRARYITEDSKGKIYVGTTEGLLAFQGDEKSLENARIYHYAYHPNDDQSISGNDVHYILPAKNGNLYLGIYGGGFDVLYNGLDFNKKPQFKAFKKSNGAPMDVVFTLQEGSAGEVWLSSQTQLIKFDPKTERFDVYNPVAPCAYSFMEAAVCKTRQGELCYGTTEGFVQFNPSKAVKSQYVPRIVLTRLQVLNKTVEAGVKGSPLTETIDDTRELKLSHKQNMLSIGFSALDYTEPDGIQYAYKLEGFDDDWHYAGNLREATYTNLPKGEYVFKVKSTNADGQWVNNERSLKIERLPSFWESAWGLAFYLAMFVLLSVLASYILFIIYRLKNDVAVEHRISNLKLQFFTDISHELRTPLTLIASPVENILRNEKLSEKVKEQLEVVQRNTERMLRLINQILDFRKIQNKKMKLVLEDVEVARFVDDICQSFQPFAEERKIAFRIIDNSNRAHLWVDKDKLEKILFNLLSNAFKYTLQGNRVEVILTDENDEVSIMVKDSGVGIGKEKLTQLFNRFETFVSANFSMQPSTGIGLSLTKELVELHKARIVVESETDKGSSFNVIFRKGCSHFDNEEDYVLQDFKQQEEVPETNRPEDETLPKLVSNSDTPVILVVEDNSELRHFLCSVLRNHYTVLEANNGKEALSLLPESSPDLIISDIMMPEMSGLELAKTIKGDMNYSHIPVVLLTAKSDTDSKLEAMQYGVDDYILKPFSSAYLEARVENLLKLRRQLQDYYCSSLTSGVISVSKPSVTSQDDVFIQRIMEYVEKNIEDSELSIDGIALFIGLSRSSLFKKIKSLTGLAPVDFIKEIRIQRAAQLIETGEYNVSQVAYMIGMSDPRYFSKCFKQKYGVNPREYKDKCHPGSES